MPKDDCASDSCKALAALSERVGSLSRRAEEDRGNLAKVLDGVAEELKGLRELISKRYGEELNLRIDERIQLDKAKHPPALPGWATLAFTVLGSIVTGLAVYTFTHPAVGQAARRIFAAGGGQ